jgi:NADPH:quinone reductase-like Zn-dependent oxidoreductase
MQMKAIRYTEHGPPEVLRLMDMPVPVPTDQQVLVRIRAASINPVDWHMMRGEPSFLKLMKPAAKGQTPGSDFAGQVEQVGAKVTQVRPGDEVFGTAWGSLAEYACTRPDLIASKPTRVTYEQAAAISLAGRTALQAVRDHGRLQPRQTVLINGAAGGVGTFAVQIARALGAEVTGVCSTRNVDLVRSIGAHHVIDYTIDDFAAMGRKYDVVIQIAGIRTNDELRGALAPRGRLVLVGGGTGRAQVENPSVPEVLGMFARNLLAPFMRQQIRVMMTKTRKSDLVYLGELVEGGKLMPVIDRTYPLTEAADAMRQLEGGHVRGKVVVTV